MARHTFSKTEDYHIEWEILGKDCHVHVQVYNWKKSVLKEGYAEFVRLKKFVRGMGYDYMVSASPNPKFCRLFGGVSVGRYREFEVMVWETAQI